MITSVIPDDAMLFDMAKLAKAQHLHIITNGKRTVLSPTIPPGWHRLIVKVKTSSLATLTEPI